MMDEETVVNRRNVRYGILFAGLGVATLIFLVVLARFVLLLLPIGEERTTIQAHPIAQMTATITPTLLPTATMVEVIAVIEETVEETAVIATVTTQPPTITPLSSATPQPPTSTPEPPAPAQLIIPSLDVAKTISYVPVVDGQWNIEALESGIGHLQTTGEYPGDDVGMTFIAHVTRPWPEIAGPFAELIFMKPGDEIIYRWQGIDYVYALESFARVKPELVESLYVPDGDVITLATCDTWDYVNWGYADRLLARARLVRQEPVPSIPEERVQ